MLCNVKHQISFRLTTNERRPCLILRPTWGLPSREGSTAEQHTALIFCAPDCLGTEGKERKAQTHWWL
eukprot:scaffold274680_cov27-Tisochrysis_lutea.AAC.2